MLVWIKFFIILFLINFFSLSIISSSLIFLLLHSELLLLTLLFLFLWVAVNYNINFMIGLALCYLMLGGLELALNFILIVL